VASSFERELRGGGRPSGPSACGSSGAHHGGRARPGADAEAPRREVARRARGAEARICGRELAEGCARDGSRRRAQGAPPVCPRDAGDAFPGACGEVDRPPAGGRVPVRRRHPRHREVHLRRPERGGDVLEAPSSAARAAGLAASPRPPGGPRRGKTGSEAPCDRRAAGGVTGGRRSARPCGGATASFRFPPVPVAAHRVVRRHPPAGALCGGAEPPVPIGTRLAGWPGEDRPRVSGARITPGACDYPPAGPARSKLYRLRTISTGGGLTRRIPAMPAATLAPT